MKKAHKLKLQGLVVKQIKHRQEKKSFSLVIWVGLLFNWFKLNRKIDNHIVKPLVLSFSFKDQLAHSGSKPPSVTFKKVRKRDIVSRSDTKLSKNVLNSFWL